MSRICPLLSGHAHRLGHKSQSLERCSSEDSSIQLCEMCFCLLCADTDSQLMTVEDDPQKMNSQTFNNGLIVLSFFFIIATC